MGGIKVWHSTVECVLSFYLPQAPHQLYIDLPLHCRHTVAQDCSGVSLEWIFPNYLAQKVEGHMLGLLTIFFLTTFQNMTENAPSHVMCSLTQMHFKH